MGLLMLLGIVAGCAQPMVTRQDAGESVQIQQVPVSAGESDKREEAPASRVADPAPDLPKNELTENIVYEFLLAEIAQQRGNPGISAQAYLDLAKRTRDPRIARRATEVSVLARMASSAVDAAKIWHEVDPKSSRALQTLSGLLVSFDRLDEARPYLEKLIGSGAMDPGDAFMQLNRTLANSKDKDGALRLVQQLAESFPKLPQAHFAVGQAAASANREDLALSSLSKSAELRPQWEAPPLLQAQILQRGKRNSDALKVLSEYLAKYPKSREVRVSYARALVAEKRYVDARGEFQRLVTDFPENPEVVLAVGLLAMQLNDYAEAEVNLKRLLSLDYPDRDSIRLYLGQIAEERKLLPEALRWYGEIVRGDHYISAQMRYAQVLARQNKLDDARAHLRNINTTTVQQKTQLLLAEAGLLRDAGQSKTAFDLLDGALGAEPNNPDLLYDHAMLAEKTDRLDTLESSLRKLIQLRPEHAHAYNALGYSLADRNIRLPEARGLIEKALALAPNDAFIIDSMGWVMYRLGEVESALTHLQRAYTERQDSEIASHLVEVLWVAGRRDEAQKVWSDALQKYPDNEALINTMKRMRR